VQDPKIELHVHLEGTIEPKTLLAIANRNGYAVGVGSVEELRELYRYRDFAHFIEVWVLRGRRRRSGRASPLRGARI